MIRNANTAKTSTALVVGELYRASPRLVTALSATLVGLVTAATLSPLL